MALRLNRPTGPGPVRESDRQSLLDLVDLNTGATRRRRLRWKMLAGLSAIGFALAGGLTLVALQIPQIGPAIRAGHGEGTRGEFTLREYGCGRFSCTWTGVFVADKGRLTLQDAAFSGHVPSGARPGVTVPGLYSGDPGTVYPVSGSNAWIADIALLAVEVLVIALCGGFVPYAIRVRRVIQYADPMTPAEREALRQRHALFRRRVDRRLQRQQRRPALNGRGRHTAR
jgi:hypothetical protein